MAPTNRDWYPLAQRRPGPPNKIGYPTRLWPLALRRRYREDKKYVVPHSSEGTLAGWLAELDSQRSPRRTATFFNPKIGPILQHYPVTAVTWANGDPDSNRISVTIENEGVVGEGLTASQEENLVGLYIWLFHRFNWYNLVRGVTVLEHNEIVATRCPSNRINHVKIIKEARRRIALMDPNLQKFIQQDAIRRAYQQVGLAIASKAQTITSYEEMRATLTAEEKDTLRYLVS